MEKSYRIAVVGAATIAGNETVRILEERGLPVRELVPLETKGNLGKSVEYQGKDIPVRAVDEKSFKDVDIAFFTAGQKVSMEYAGTAVKQGSAVIDMTAAFRLDSDVPLVVPEINSGKISGHKGIIASPSPSAIQLALVLHPIHKSVGVRRVVLSTYQAVSDEGDAGMSELTEQITEMFNFREPVVSVFPHQIAFDVIPKVGLFLDGANTASEMGIIAETRKIIGEESIGICATTAYVPVFYSSSQSVNIETVSKITPEKVRKLLEGSPGVRIEDDPAGSVYPLAVYATGNDECFAGRIRKDLSADNGIVMWTAMDNVRKGAALNAVQIAEHLIAMNGGFR